MPVISPEYPGTPLSVGSSGTPVARMQTYLNAMKNLYPNIGLLTVDGKFGNNTKNSTITYQAVKGLKTDGVIGANTWNTIVPETTAYNGSTADTYPGISMQSGTNSQDVTTMQKALNKIATVYTAINTLAVDGAYGGNTTAAVNRFQMQFGLTVDGAIGKNTWNKIIDVRNHVDVPPRVPVSTPYAGYPLSVGSSGSYVRCAQSYLNGAGASPKLTVDGSFGNATKNATIAFQAKNGLTPDGVIGSATWAKLVPAFNASL